MSDNGTDAVRTRIFLVDDHAIVREGLAELLSNVPDFEVVGEAGTASQALALILATEPDVAVLDARLPDGSGIDVCRDVRAALPATYCLILTSYDEDDAVLASVLAGASGYVLKEVGRLTLVDAIRQVRLGRSLLDPAIIRRVMERVRETADSRGRVLGLTDREHDVLDLIADGLTNKEIAARLNLAEKTVKNYVSSLLAKLGLERRTQAAILATRLLGR